MHAHWMAKVWSVASSRQPSSTLWPVKTLVFLWNCLGGFDFAVGNGGTLLVIVFTTGLPSNPPALPSGQDHIPFLPLQPRVLWGLVCIATQACGYDVLPLLSYPVKGCCLFLRETFPEETSWISQLHGWLRHWRETNLSYWSQGNISPVVFPPK